MRKNKFLRYFGIFFVFVIIVNFTMAIISKFLPISFEKPHEIIEPPEIFFSLKIGKYLININQTIMNTWAIMIIIILILYLGTRKLSVDNPNFFQLILEEYYNLIENSFLNGYGKYKDIFMPFFSAMFSMVLLLNISMFIFPFAIMFKRVEHKILLKPFFRTATADMNTAVGLALVVFVVFVGAAIYRMGVLGFIKELSHPFVLMLPINIIGEFAKPINISMRLFGNMFAGLVIMALVYGLVLPDYMSKFSFGMLNGSVSLALLWPNYLQIYLDFIIGIIQAYVFTVLSSVYIKQMLIGEENH